MGRIAFLRTKYNVVDDSELQVKLDYFEDLGDVHKIHTLDDGLFAFYSIITEKHRKPKMYLSETGFQTMLRTDFTKNKMYLQWILTIFNRLLNDGEIEQATRLVIDDLSKTHENLILFDQNKRKKRFKELCLKNYAVKDLGDPTNINQYTSIEQLFAVVHPFKEIVDVSVLENELENLVSLGQARIPVKDEKYTVFIPLTLMASEIFSFTNWCTAKKGNTMFKHYTSQLKGDGTKSELIIIIDNGFFKNENDNIYQIHFESGQIMDIKDSVFSEIKSSVLSKSISVRNFFYEYMSENYSFNAKHSKDNSKYYEKLMEFGFSNVLLDVMSADKPGISFKNIEFGELPSLKRFKNLKVLYLANINLNKWNEEIFELPFLELISLPKNNLKTIPKGISLAAKHLKFINLTDNPIVDVPENIKYLDPSNGGSLVMMSIGDNPTLRKKLENLLPSVIIK